MIKLDGSEEFAEYLAAAFKKVDWLIPAYLQSGFLSKLAAVINQASEDERLDVFEAVLAMVYSPEYMARVFLERYSKIIHIRDFAPQIDEAIRAYFLGLKNVSVVAMIPIIEGIVRKIATASGRDPGMGTAGVRAEFSAFVEREVSSPNCYGERLIMLGMMRDYMRDRFLQNTDRFAGMHQFNRHGILHGVFDNYGEGLNFLRTITILDLLVFIISLQWGGVSVFLPDASAASEALGAEYTRIRIKSDTKTKEVPVWVMKLFLGE